MNYEYKQFRRRKLPHIHPPGATLFVTLRLAGTIPKVVLQEWAQEKAWLDDQLKRVSNRAAETKDQEEQNHLARVISFRRRWFRRFEEILDQAQHGPTWLKDPKVAQLVEDSLRHRDEKVYRLHA